MKERKARVEDALHATGAAVEEGIVPGGGIACLDLIPALDRVKKTRNIGYDVLRGEDGDIPQSGVIDPTKVTLTATKDAMRVAEIIFDTDALITKVPEPKKFNSVPSPENMDY